MAKILEYDLFAIELGSYLAEPYKQCRFFSIQVVS